MTQSPALVGNDDGEGISVGPSDTGSQTSRFWRSMASVLYGTLCLCKVLEGYASHGIEDQGSILSEFWIVQKLWLMSTSVQFLSLDMVILWFVFCRVRTDPDCCYQRQEWSEGMKVIPVSKQGRYSSALLLIGEFSSESVEIQGCGTGSYWNGCLWRPQQPMGTRGSSCWNYRKSYQWFRIVRGILTLGVLCQKKSTIPFSIQIFFIRRISLRNRCIDSTHLSPDSYLFCSSLQIALKLKLKLPQILVFSTKWKERLSCFD